MATTTIRMLKNEREAKSAADVVSLARAMDWGEGKRPAQKSDRAFFLELIRERKKFTREGRKMAAFGAVTKRGQMLGAAAVIPAENEVEWGSEPVAKAALELQKKGIDLHDLAYFGSLGVHHRFQRGGISTALTARCLDFARKSMGAKIVIAQTSPDARNSKMVRQFTRDGWVKLDYEGKFQNGMRRHFYYKKL
ncbi:MAG: GNAT family N-acetyltransferase [Candidatus Micrarchaeota archaeon]